jgi:hypothetical protein
MSYDRNKAIAYAHKWAFLRNSNYYSFDLIGGDCTNFISQCLYAGCGVMNYTRDFGWYYRSSSDRAAAWAGVEYLFRFLTSNKAAGPYATQQPLSRTQPGDVIQLDFSGHIYSHSLLVVEAGINPAPDNILIATHTYDADYKPLSRYSYLGIRLLHIEGVR